MQLTQGERDQLSKFRKEWLTRIYSTEPADRYATEAAINYTYEEARVPKPKLFLWFEDLLSAGVAVQLLRDVKMHATLPAGARALQERVMTDLRGRLGCRSFRDVRKILGVEHNLYEHSEASFEGLKVVTAIAAGNALQFGIAPVALDAPAASKELDQVVNDIESAAATFQYEQDDLVGREMGPGIPGHIRYPDFIVCLSAYRDYSFGLLAKCDIMRHLWKWDKGTRYSGLIEAAKNCAAWWPFRRAAVIAEHPKEVRLDFESHIHNSAGPALTYRTGLKVFAWHGQWVPSKLVEQADRITLPAIRKARSAAARELMVEIYGRERYERECTRKKSSST